MITLQTRVSGFAAAMVITAVLFFCFIVAFAAGAEEGKVVVVRGQEYILTPGQNIVDPIVVDEVKGLAVRNVDGSVVYIAPRATATMVVPQATTTHYETRYLPDGRSYQVLVGSQANATDVAMAEHDLRVMREMNRAEQDARRQAAREREQKHDARMDWSREIRDYQRDAERRAEAKRRAEARERYEQQRARENAARQISRRVDRAGDRLERIARDAARQKSR